MKGRPAVAEELLSDATVRVEELVEAADRSAGAVRLSMSEALTGLGQTRRDVLVGELATELVERVETLRQEAHELRAILVRASRALASDTTSTAEVEADPPVDSPGRPAPSGSVSANGPSASTPDESVAQEPDDGPSQGLLLLATQMAVAGSAREEIAARLRNDFGVEDPDEVLTRALGAPAE